MFEIFIGALLVLLIFWCISLQMKVSKLKATDIRKIELCALAANVFKGNDADTMRHALKPYEEQEFPLAEYALQSIRLNTVLGEKNCTITNRFFGFEQKEQLLQWLKGKGYCVHTDQWLHEFKIFWD
jgi:hypothetical protein